jgi:hypothetical protein
MVPWGLMNRLPASGGVLLAFGRQLTLFVGIGFDGVVYFNGGAALQATQNSVAANDNLVAFLEASDDFDVSGAGDSGGDGDELCAEFLVVIAEQVDALGDLGFGCGSCGCGGEAGRRLAGVGGENLFRGGVALDEGLDGNGKGVGLVRSGDFSGCGEAGAELVEIYARGGIEGDDDLEVFGLFGAGGGLAGGDTSGAEEGLVADLGDVAFEDAAGQGIDSDVDGLVHADVDDVGLVDFDLGGDDGHVGEGHEGRAFGVLDAEDDGLTFADGDVGDEAVEWGAADGFVEGVEVGALAGDGLIHVAALGLGLGEGLGKSGLPLRERRDGHIISGFLGVIVLLGNELVVVECLGTSVVELLLLEVSLALLDVGFGGLLCGKVARDVGLGGGDAGLLCGDGGLGLNALDGGECGAGFDAIAFFHVEVGDASEGCGADVDVGLRLYLSGAADDGDEVLMSRLCGRDLGDVGLTVKNASDDDTGENQDDRGDDDDLLSAHCCFLKPLFDEPEVLW